MVVNLASFFRSCATNSEADQEARKSNFKHRSCFRDSPFTDRIIFRYSYDPYTLVNGSIIKTEADHLFTDGGVAHSTISSDTSGTINMKHPSTTVEIRYGCLPGADGPITISYMLSVSNKTSSDYVKLSWQKQCRSGSPTHINILSVSPSVDTKMWPPSDTRKLMNVSPSSTVTFLDASLTYPYLQQDFFVPIIKVEDISIVQAVLRGTNSKGGVLRSSYTTRFHVVYECKSSGSSEIFFTFGVPPFTNVSLSWKKGRLIYSTLSILFLVLISFVT